MFDLVLFSPQVVSKKMSTRGPTLGQPGPAHAHGGHQPVPPYA